MSGIHFTCFFLPFQTWLCAVPWSGALPCGTLSVWEGQESCACAAGAELRGHGSVCLMETLGLLAWRQHQPHPGPVCTWEAWTASLRLVPSCCRGGGGPRTEFVPPGRPESGPKTRLWAGPAHLPPNPPGAFPGAEAPMQGQTGISAREGRNSVFFWE